MRRLLHAATIATAATAATFAAALLCLAAGDPKVLPGPWNKRDVPAGWVVIETEHYHVQCQAGKAKGEALAAHLEAMLKVYEDFLPTRRKPETFVLKVFKDRDDFLVYNPEGKTAAAYYDKSSKELVAYDSGIVLGTRDQPDAFSLPDATLARFTEAERARLAELFAAITDGYIMDTARTLSHEGWHQYFHMYTVSWVAMPAWLNEGVGDYFYTATADAEAGASHGFRLGDLNAIRLRTVQRAMVEGTTVDFRTLLGFEREDYYSNAAVYYAQGWSMVQYLMHHEKAELRALIPRLIKDFKASKNFVKATEKAFDGLDLDELDRAWIAWVTGLKADDPLRDLAAEFGARLPADELETPFEGLRVQYTWHVEHPGDLFGG